MDLRNPPRRERRRDIRKKNRACNARHVAICHLLRYGIRYLSYRLSFTSLRYSDADGYKSPRSLLRLGYSHRELLPDTTSHCIREHKIP